MVSLYRDSLIIDSVLSFFSGIYTMDLCAEVMLCLKNRTNHLICSNVKLCISVNAV